MTTTNRFNRVATPVEALERAFPGRSLAAVANADDTPDADILTGAEVRAWDRERALAYFDRKVPDRHRNARADHPEVVAWVEQFLATKGACDSLMLQGDLGTGKTHQAYGALKAIAEAGIRPVYWRAVCAADLYARLRSLSGTEAETELALYTEAELLLLDDLGTSRTTGWVADHAEETTFRLVNHRYNGRLPTIITTNVDTDKLTEQLGQRTESRLVEMCATWVDLRGADRRFG